MMKILWTFATVLKTVLRIQFDLGNVCLEKKNMEEGMDRRTIRPDVLMLMTNQGETKASILSLLCILRGVIGGLKG